MGGGLLNLVAYGNQNIILNGNPSKTMFKTSYSKYTNFGLQKFRIDYEGNQTLKLSTSETFTFKIPRHADLLMDTYLVMDLPDIWSPVHPPNNTITNQKWRPYEFKWIKNLGTQLIKKVSFTVGGHVIQEYSGQYMYNMVERDFDESSKQHFYNMTGNIVELNDPSQYGSRQNVYPSAYNMNNIDINGNPIDNNGTANIQPSIMGRKIYIPLNAWFTLSSKMAFPLTSLQYNELYITIEIRPINELFIVRNIQSDNEEYISPSASTAAQTLFNFKNFLAPPPLPSQVGPEYILDFTNNATYNINKWNPNIHLISTYGFLSEDEVRVFALKEQKYLIKQVYEYEFISVKQSNKNELKSMSMVANWMWYFQRNDASLRNEWTNYTNWPYNYLPSNVVEPDEIPAPITNLNVHYINYAAVNTSPYKNPDNSFTNIFISGLRNNANIKNIMTKWALVLDGKYREHEMDAGVFNYIEKYLKSKGNSPEGLYSYNFNLTTSPFDYQPNGAINLSKFNSVEMEFSTIQPDDEAAGFGYTYDMHIMEERYNVLIFSSGNAGLMYAR
jgi:hypothetical protein